MKIFDVDGDQGIEETVENIGLTGRPFFAPVRVPELIQTLRQPKLTGDIVRGDEVKIARQQVPHIREDQIVVPAMRRVRKKGARPW